MAAARLGFWRVEFEANAARAVEICCCVFFSAGQQQGSKVSSESGGLWDGMWICGMSNVVSRRKADREGEAQQLMDGVEETVTRLAAAEIWDCKYIGMEMLKTAWPRKDKNTERGGISEANGAGAGAGAEVGAEAEDALSILFLLEPRAT